MAREICLAFLFRVSLFLFDALTVIQINNVRVFFQFRLVLCALFNLQMLNTQKSHV